jgi:rhamnose utilization protein RhaD (predicted bifunctional aldolase and dehydrogenase)
MAEQESLSTGLLHLLEPVTTEYDQKIRAVQLAQAALAERIDALSKQLSDCVTEAEFVDVTPYLQKLVNSRKKIMNVATSLNNISDRLARMNRQTQNKVGLLTFINLTFYSTQKWPNYDRLDLRN